LKLNRSRTIRSKHLKSVVIVCALSLASQFLAGASGVAYAGEARGELLCAPSSQGYITTWLMAGPVQFLRAEQLDRDFLQGVGGEANARPREGDIADAATGLAWQASVWPNSVVDLKDRCLPLGESAFYLSAVLVAQKDLKLTLVVAHSGSARAWVEGRRVIRSNPDPLGPGYRTVGCKLSLRAGQRVHCLLKLGSDARRLQFLVGLLRGRRPVQPDDVRVALPLGPDSPAVESYVLSSLRLGVGREKFVHPGKRTGVTFDVAGGYPLCDGRVAATITIKDSRGRKVEDFSVPAARLRELAARPALLSWTPPKDGRSAYFELLAQVTYEGRELGVLSKTVYSPSGIGHWAGDLRKRLEAVSARRKPARDELAHVQLKIEKADILQRGDALRGPASEEAHGELKVASEWLSRLERGKGLPPLEPGVRELAYLAEQDDSPQPYYLHIPRSYTGRQPVPAIVYLHGYAPWLDKTNWHGLSYGLTDLAEARGYLIICPFARSNTDFQGIGEVDVLHVLQLARRHVRIDPDRVFLLGYSMGGMGAYTIAAHYPHLWAGVVVLCGRADYYFWHELDPHRVEPFKRHLLDIEFGWPLARNFRHLPVLAFQGTADVLIKPEQAYRFVEQLSRLGSKAQLVRLEGQSHWIADETFSTPRAFDWMDRQRRVAAPRTIRFKTYTLRYHRTYWLTIDALERWGKPAEVEVTLHPRNRLELKASNVARLTLRPPRQLCNPKLNFPATINGRPRELKPNVRGELLVNISPVKAGRLRKTPTLCGPIKDAFNRRFLFVYGTTGGEEATKRNRALAARMQEEWRLFAKGRRELTRDTDLSPQEMARSHLFLFGTPRTNAILAKIASKLPIRITSNGYEILGKTYRATDKTGLMFIYPNPLAPDRYVVVCSGLHYGEWLDANHKYDLLPDFIVYSDERDYDKSNAFYCAGFFDPAWQLDPKLIWASDGRPKPKPAAAVPAELPRVPLPAVP